MKNNENCWSVITKYKKFFRRGMNIAVGIIILLIFTSIIMVTELTKGAFFTVLGLPVSCFISLILFFVLLVVIYMVNRKNFVFDYFRKTVGCINEYFHKGDNEFQNIETGEGSTIIKYAGKNWLIIPQLNSFIIIKYQKDEIYRFIVGIQTVLKLRRKRDESFFNGSIEIDRDLRFFQSKLYTNMKYRGKPIWGKNERMVKLSKEIVDYLNENSLGNKILGINPGIFNNNNLLIFNIVIPNSREEFGLILNSLNYVVQMIERYKKE